MDNKDKTIIGLVVLLIIAVLIASDIIPEEMQVYFLLGLLILCFVVVAVIQTYHFILGLKRMKIIK